MQNGNVIAVPDVHVPYHSKRAWDMMLEIIDYTKPELTIQLGDFADNKAFSRHGRKFGEKHYDPERDMQRVKEEAQRLEKASHGRLEMLLGNHDIWPQRVVAENAPALEKFVPTPGSLYGLKKEPHAYQEIYKVGKVGYVHDLGFSGVNAIRSTLQTAGHCVVFGHSHRGGVAYSGTAENDRWFGMNCGWLGDQKEITYMHKAAMRDWQLGFGAVSYCDGLAFASFVPFIERGRKLTALYRGKRFTH